jgi:hypothetical protein
MTIPRRWGRRNPLAGAQIAPQRIRRANVQPAELGRTEHRTYLLRQIAAGNVRWSHAGGKWHWRLDRVDITRQGVLPMITAQWVAVSTTGERRHLHLTPLGREVAGIEKEAD